MAQLMNFTEWLVLDEHVDAVSSVAFFYEELAEAFGGDKRTREEELELARKSNLKRMTIGKWLIKPTIHGSAQAYDRVPNITAAQWTQMHKRMVDALAKITDIPTKRETEIVVYSKSLNQAYVVAHDPQNGELRIMTVFPNGRQIAKPGSKKVMIESAVDVVYLGLDEEGDEHEFFNLSFINEEELSSQFFIDADRLGLVYDQSQVLRIVNANDNVPDGKTVEMKVFDSRSPSGPEQKVGFLNYNIIHNGQV